MTNINSKPALHLIPVQLGTAPTNLWLPSDVQNIAANIKYYIAENAKTARLFLKQINTTHAIRDINIKTIEKNSTKEELVKWLEPYNSGHSIGLVSEAGCPAIADPGANIVEIAHSMGITVMPHTGPSSIILGLMASGLNGQSFAFHGYAPVDTSARERQIKLWENISRKQNQTQIAIETPYRNDAFMDSLIKTLNPATKLSIALGLHTPEQLIQTLTVDQWRKRGKPTPMHKIPCLFLFLAN